MRKLTAADICEVSGYNRDQLRSLLKELPKWTSAPGARRARAYTPQDLIVLNVVHTLDRVIGMRRKAIASVFPLLRQALSGPKPIAAQARLSITFTPRQRVDFLDAGICVQEGVVIFLQPLLDRVDQYLGVTALKDPIVQPDLRLGPGVMRSRRRRTAT
jgi:hypothetical protein